MARNPQIAPENNFTKGLISEATGLTFPEQAATDTMDCIFEQTGMVTRRLGFDYEASASTSFTATRSSTAMVNFLWEAAAGSGNTNFIVSQIGSTLYFYKLGSSNTVSTTKKSFTVSLDDSTLKASGAPATNTEPCQFTSGFGTLFVTHPYCNPFYVSYDPTGDTISFSAISVQIRDFEGEDDGYAVDTRPTDYSLGKTTRKHLYNLMNQGWYINFTIGSSNFGTTGTPIYLWNNARNDWPSNADVWWQFKDSSEDYNKNFINKFAIGSSPAPMGHYIYSAWNMDRQGTYTASGLTSNADTASPNVTNKTSSYYRPSACAFFAGRVWYSGVNYTGYNTQIYFSKTVEDYHDYGYCMQVNDPTSETNSDLLPTDGGVIVIPDMGNVLRMMAVGSDLVVFASNGLWVISGSKGLSFQANDYSVRKLSNVSALGSYNIVNVEGFPMFWNLNGIYTIQPAQVTGDIAVTSLTDTTIRTWFSDIPSLSKQHAQVSYNPLTKIVSWLYRSAAPSTVDQRYEYDRVLNLNVLTGAFYPWTIQQASGYPVVNGILCVQNYGAFSPVTKYQVSRNTTGTTYQITWAENRSTNYKDWETYSTGLDYSSYAVTGYKIHGQGVTNFQQNYVIVYCKNATNSSLGLRGRWMYANNANTGLWTASQEVYNSTVSNRDYVTRRIKIRGNGLVCQLAFTSTSGKPFYLAGWAVFETANAQP